MFDTGTYATNIHVQCHIVMKELEKERIGPWMEGVVVPCFATDIVLMVA